MGNPVKGPVANESDVYYGARRSLVAGDYIHAGAMITAEMVDTKRPQNGLKPGHLGMILGQRAKVDIAPDEFITLDKIG